MCVKDKDKDNDYARSGTALLVRNTLLTDRQTSIKVCKVKS